METILYNISQVLGISIIHSLWQGLLIYFILRIAFSGIPSLSAVKKYNLALFAMLSISACFIYTLLTEINAYNWVSLKSHNALPLLPYLNLSANSHYQSAWYFTIAGYLPYICALYFAGLIINLVRLGWEWDKIREIKQSLISAGQLQQYIDTFSKKLNIKKPVQLKFSEMIDVPCMIGYFKPLILLPVSICTDLSSEEVEAILLHELSHIKRNDYLINLLQQVITIMLFFNPFVHLINRIINQERENGCDDLVVEKTGKPLTYAKALLKLEEVKTLNLQFALAVTGEKFHLLNRIERIMKTKKHMGNMRHFVIALFLLTGSISCIAWFNPKIAEAAVTLKKAKLLTTESFAAAVDSTNNILLSDTVKHKHKGKIIAKGKKAKITSEKLAYKNKTEIYDDGDSFASDSVRKFFVSPEWKSQMEAMKKQGELMKKQFDSPEWKNQMETIKKQGELMKKQFDSPEWKNQVLAMRKQGEEMKKQFNSPEWKSQMETIKKQGELMKKQFDSPEWKSQVENMKKQGELMKKQFDSPEWKGQMENIKKQGELMKKQFDSPEWKSQVETMKKQGELMKKQFNSPEWKKQMEQIKKQGELMKKQFDSPEWKKQMEDLKKEGKYYRNHKWKLKDSVSGTKIYVPEKDTVKED